MTLVRARAQFFSSLVFYTRRHTRQVYIGALRFLSYFYCCFSFWSDESFAIRALTFNYGSTFICFNIPLQFFKYNVSQNIKSCHRQRGQFSLNVKDTLFDLVLMSMIRLWIAASKLSLFFPFHYSIEMPEIILVPGARHFFWSRGRIYICGGCMLRRYSLTIPIFS